MKRITVFILLLFIAFSMYGKATKIDSFSGYIWLKYIRDLLEIDVDLYLDTDTHEIYLFFDIPKTPVQIVIDEEYREHFLKHINAFQRKEKIADRKETTYDLELGKLPTANCRFYKRNKWHDSRFNSKANFFSQKEEYHQFLLMLSPMKSMTDSNIKIDGITIYFDSGEMRELEKYLQEDKYQSLINK